MTMKSQRNLVADNTKLIWGDSMQINTRKKDVIWNYLGIFFSLGSQVIWLPVLIHYLPPDILGLWYVFVSIGGMVELLDSGFTPTLSHCMSYAWSGAQD